MGYVALDGLAWVTACTWDQAPHLDEQTKEDLFRALPPHQRDARSKGIPSLGSGAIYQIPEEDFIVNDFEIPEHWPRAYGLDVGSKTAAIWGARDGDNGVTYVFSEHFAANAIPEVHATAIKSRGAEIPGVIDPAARGRSQIDGQSLIDLYRVAGLDILPADNKVHAGIYKAWQGLVNGKIKVFRSLSFLRAEYRMYRRDEKGNIVKQNDHMMDAWRYLIMSGMDRATVPGPKSTNKYIPWAGNNQSFNGWQA